MDLRALIFMPALVGAVIFGFVFLLYFCNYYLTVLESTGAGAKEVTWVSEPPLDHFWKLWYLLWLGGLWFGPAYFIGRAAVGSGSEWLTLAIPFLVLWVCYPLSQLSSLSASSIWIPLTPDVFARLAQKPAVTLGFLALSAVAMAVVAVGFKWTFQTADEWSLLMVGAPVLVVGALVYARLLGRLAFALRFTKGLFPTNMKKKKKRKADAESESERPLPDAEEPEPQRPAQPSDLPPLDSPDGELVGYNVLMADDDPAPSPKKRVRAEVAEAAEAPEEPAEERPERPEPPPLPPRRRPAPGTAVERGHVWTDEDDETPTAYGVREPEAQPAEELPAEVARPREDEMRLLSRDEAPKKPRRVWGPELLAFLGQPGTVSAILIASGFCFVVGAMVRIARAYNPAAGGG